MSGPRCTYRERKIGCHAITQTRCCALFIEKFIIAKVTTAGYPELGLGRPRVDPPPIPGMKDRVFLILSERR
jgi:hypothetical protein